MFKIAVETQNVREEVAEMLQNLDLFEFEDRKHLQQFMTELYNQYREVLDETLDFNKVETVNALVEMYNQPGMSAFAGNILRIYARSSRLVGAFENMEILEKLTLLITNPDFSI